MKTHTPGPWRTTGLNVRAGDALICYATNHWADCETPESERQANADLIASAPDLLAALEVMTKAYVELVESEFAPAWNAENDKEVISARAIIAKAKGQP
jgi:hypothetical protein